VTLRGVELLFLLSYSPDLKSIEEVSTALSSAKARGLAEDHQGSAADLPVPLRSSLTTDAARLLPLAIGV